MKKEGRKLERNEGGRKERTEREEKRHNKMTESE
jgi:hypothetical protein